MAERSPSTVEEWDAYFDEFYLPAYADLVSAAENERQALAVARLAALPVPAELLDVPAGYGRIAVPLARAGYRVTAVDRSRALLDEAGRRAGDGPSPQLIVADYRELPFADRSFDGALNLFSSLGYLDREEDTRVLAEIHRVLRPGGSLVVEAMHRDLLAHRFQDRDWRQLADDRFLLEQRSFDACAGIATTTQTLVGDGCPQDVRSVSDPGVHGERAARDDRRSRLCGDSGLRRSRRREARDRHTSRHRGAAPDIAAGRCRGGAPAAGAARAARTTRTRP